MGRGGQVSGKQGRTRAIVTSFRTDIIGSGTMATVTISIRASNITSRKEPAVWRGNRRSCAESDVYLGNQKMEDFSQNQVILSEVTRTKLKNQHRVSRPIKSGLDA